MSFCVGIDIGGTTCTVSIGDLNRQVVLVSDQFSTHSADGPAATVDAITTEILSALPSLDVSITDVLSVGLSTPGPATMDGVLLGSPNLDADLWDQCPIRGLLEHRLQAEAPSLRVHYIGDGQAAALGEYNVRCGRLSWERAELGPDGPQALDSLFMVTVGTGLGGGEVRNGCAIRGSEGRAGHAGHVFLPPDVFRHEHDRNLMVGNAYSTLESAVSLTALAHQLEYRLTREEWSDHPLNASSASSREKAKGLRELAAEGDALAIELFDDQARALGVGLLVAAYLGDHDLIVIGGGVCDLNPALRDRYLAGAERAYLEHALDGFRNLKGLEFSICGDEAPVVGALAHAYSGLSSD